VVARRSLDHRQHAHAAQLQPEPAVQPVSGDAHPEVGRADMFEDRQIGRLGADSLGVQLGAERRRARTAQNRPHLVQRRRVGVPQGGRPIFGHMSHYDPSFIRV